MPGGSYSGLAPKVRSARFRVLVAQNGDNGPLKEHPMELFFILVIAIVIAAFLAFFARSRPSRTVVVERDPVETEVVERPARRRVVETERTYESRY
jgi:hypothetical protein